MDKRTLARTLLFKESFIFIPEVLLQVLDPYEAIILGKLCSKYNYYREKGDLVDDWFFQTILDLEHSLGINEYLQRQAVRSLESIGFVRIKKMGNPPRRYFYIDFEEIYRVTLEGKPVKNIKAVNSNKKAFYDELNRAAYSTKEEFDKAIDNIPKELGDIMFAWSRFCKQWKWNSSEFGKLNGYWKPVYRNRKPFNFDNMDKYFEVVIDPSILDFINFDRSCPEDLGIKTFLQLQKEQYTILGDMNGKKE